MDRSPCIVFNHKCGHLHAKWIIRGSLTIPQNPLHTKSGVTRKHLSGEKVYLRTFSWPNVLILYQILCCFNHVTRNAHHHAEPRNITFNGQCALKSTRESWLYLNKIFGKNSLNRIASSVSNNNVLYCIMI